jgi:hypothetical protein
LQSSFVVHSGGTQWPSTPMKPPLATPSPAWNATTR